MTIQLTQTDDGIAIAATPGMTVEQATTLLERVQRLILLSCSILWADDTVSDGDIIDQEKAEKRLRETPLIEINGAITEVMRKSNSNNQP